MTLSPRRQRAPIDAQLVSLQQVSMQSAALQAPLRHSSGPLQTSPASATPTSARPTSLARRQKLPPPWGGDQQTKSLLGSQSVDVQQARVHVGGPIAS